MNKSIRPTEIESLHVAILNKPRHHVPRRRRVSSPFVAALGFMFVFRASSTSRNGRAVAMAFVRPVVPSVGIVARPKWRSVKASKEACLYSGLASSSINVPRRIVWNGSMSPVTRSGRTDSRIYSSLKQSDSTTVTSPLTMPPSSENRSIQLAVAAAITSTLIAATSVTPVGSALYHSASDATRFLFDAYGTSLIENPLPTKSLTSGTLCGVGDAIAQGSDANVREFNRGRCFRFAAKGCVGGVIWTSWYNSIDGFLDPDNNPGGIFGLVGVYENDAIMELIRSHVVPIKTMLSIVIEQFFWCPIVFGTFEIPVSTLLNGGRVDSIRDEVDSKLDGLLWSNAKVWTFANMIIYSSPVEWRTPISNIVDILWQSIVSDVAADCGNSEDEDCDVPTSFN